MKNFAKGQLSGSHGTGDTALNMVSGHGSRFDAGNVAVIWDAQWDDPADAYHNSAAELVLVVGTPTANQLPSVTRAYESTTALNLVGGTTWNVMTVLSKEWLDTINTKILARMARGSDLTESSGAITITKSNHRVDTSGGNVVVDTINGGVADQLLILKRSSGSGTLTLEHGTGNIFMKSAADAVIAANTESVLLYFDGGTQWICLTE